MTKEQLKSIVKECLVEILVEGLSDETPLVEMTKKRKRRAKKRRKSRKSADHTLFNAESDNRDEKRFENAVNESVQRISSDPVMQSILGDTARTTYQEQMGHEMRNPGAMTVVGSDGRPTSNVPDDFVSQNADKWAQLAFADPVGK